MFAPWIVVAFWTKRKLCVYSLATVNVAAKESVRDQPAAGDQCC